MRDDDQLLQTEAEVALQKRLDWSEAMEEDRRRHSAAAVRRFIDGHVRTSRPSACGNSRAVDIYTPKPGYVSVNYGSKKDNNIHPGREALIASERRTP